MNNFLLTITVVLMLSNLSVANTEPEVKNSKTCIAVPSVRIGNSWYRSYQVDCDNGVELRNVGQKLVQFGLPLPFNWWKSVRKKMSLEMSEVGLFEARFFNDENYEHIDPLHKAYYYLDRVHVFTRNKDLESDVKYCFGVPENKLVETSKDLFARKYSSKIYCKGEDVITTGDYNSEEDLKKEIKSKGYNYLMNFKDSINVYKISL